MSLNFSANISQGAISEIERRIKGKVMSASFKQGVAQSILSMPSVQKWLGFLGSSDFSAEFGVPSSIASRMSSQFVKEISNVIVEDAGGAVFIRAINEDALRAITDWQWGLSNVNAWDAYERGIIGGKRTSVIKGYSIDRTLSPAERKFSRSGLALMKRGGSFRINTPAAPKVFSVRSNFISSAEAFASMIAGKIKI